MAVVVQGIPERISPADYRRLIESLGLDVEHLVSLTFHPRSIEAEVVALNAAGEPYAEGDDIATHQISIPVED